MTREPAAWAREPRHSSLHATSLDAPHLAPGAPDAAPHATSRGNAFRTVSPWARLLHTSTSYYFVSRLVQYKCAVEQVRDSGARVRRRGARSASPPRRRTTTPRTEPMAHRRRSALLARARTPARSAPRAAVASARPRPPRHAPPRRERHRARTRTHRRPCAGAPAGATWCRAGTRPPPMTVRVHR